VCTVNRVSESRASGDCAAAVVITDVPRARRQGANLTLVTVPGAGHFVQQDASELVSSTMRWWLLMRTR